MSTPKWFQHEISITAPSRGCHLITSQIQKTISKDITQIKMGMCNIFVQHTSASLTINENADPDVRHDMEAALNKIVPASWNHDGTFKHTMEGDDDMPVSAILLLSIIYIYIYIYIYIIIG
jgi:secondary thiamine-phosphate synthase enzyme